MLEAMRITLNDPDVFAVTAFLAGLIGVCVGSFLNVVIYRLPRGMSLAMPPSHCPSCNRRLRWFENIPILSYLFLRGRCRTCRARISPRYTVVELANGALWVAAVFVWRSNILMAVVAALAVSVCLCVCFIDWEQGMIPDRFHIMLALLAIPGNASGHLRWMDFPCYRCGGRRRGACVGRISGIETDRAGSARLGGCEVRRGQRGVSRLEAAFADASARLGRRMPLVADPEKGREAKNGCVRSVSDLWFYGGSVCGRTDHPRVPVAFRMVGQTGKKISGTP